MSEDGYSNDEGHVKVAAVAGVAFLLSCFVVDVVALIDVVAFAVVVFAVVRVVCVVAFVVQYVVAFIADVLDLSSPVINI